jgi:hypothetical protein
MIDIIKADERHLSNFGWLKTYWLFSFSNYFDPHNIQFGALRVFNDDVVQPGTGFPTHPHKEMEIITIVLDGEMTHQDSMRNKTVIKAGDVQRMSAGTGLTDSLMKGGRSISSISYSLTQDEVVDLAAKYICNGIKIKYHSKKEDLLIGYEGLNKIIP